MKKLKKSNFCRKSIGMLFTLLLVTLTVHSTDYKIINTVQYDEWVTNYYPINMSKIIAVKFNSGANGNYLVRFTPLLSGGPGNGNLSVKLWTKDANGKPTNPVVVFGPVPTSSLGITWDKGEVTFQLNQAITKNTDYFIGITLSNITGEGLGWLHDEFNFGPPPFPPNPATPVAYRSIRVPTAETEDGGATWTVYDVAITMVDVVVSNIPAAAPTVILGTAPTIITPTSAKLYGNLTNNGSNNCTEKGICWSTSASPTTSASKGLASNPSTTGAYSVTISPTNSLTSATKYYYRPFATSPNGTSYSATDGTFWTLAAELAAHPASFMMTAANSTSRSLSFSAPSTVTNCKGYLILRREDGTFPTTTDVTDGIAPASQTLPEGTSLVTNISTTTATSYIDAGLESGKTYNYRLIPYNWSSPNVETYNYYTTGGLTAGIPTLSTDNATSITTVSATANGSITLTNGSNATNRGVVLYNYTGTYKIIGDPGVTNLSETGSFGAASFTKPLTGLSVNTRYNYRVHATNMGGTAYGSTAAFWTLAAVPQAPTVDSPTATSLNVTVNENGNPANTVFAIMETSTNKYVLAAGTLGNTTVWQVDSIWGTKTVTGLTTGTAYTFKVKAKNEYGTETLFSATTTGTAVGPPVVTTNATTLITATTATGNGNITSTGGSNPTKRGLIHYPYTNTDKMIGDAGVIEVSETGNFSTGIFNRSFTGLSVNTRYNARAYANNAIDTAYGLKNDFWTLANTPSAPTVSNPTETSLDITVNENGNPSITLFAIHETSTNKFVQSNGSLGLSAVWQADSVWATITVTGLTLQTLYTFEVKAKNGNLSETGYGTSASGTPVSPPQPQVSSGAVSSITPTTAVGNGSITNIGDSSPTNRGVIFYPYTGTSKAIGDADVTNVSESGTFTQGPFTALLTGLSVNTRYNARAHATNFDGAGYGTRVDFWTLANTPSAPSVNNPTDTTLHVTVNANGNPAITEYAIFDTVTAKYVQTDGTLNADTAWLTKALWETGAGNTARPVKGLQANTLHTFKIKARNSADTLTTFSGLTSMYTMAAIPGMPTVNAADSTSLNVAINANGNSTTTGFAIYERKGNKYVQTDGSLGDNTVWQTEALWETDATNTSKKVVGLSPDTEYTFLVKARNGEDVETAFSDADSLFTLPNVPSAPAVDNPTMTTLDVTINENGNPASTEYAIHETTLDKFIQSDGKFGASAVWQTDTLWGTKTVMELDTATSYTFEVKARNAALTETVYGDTISASTLRCYMGEAWTIRTPAISTLQPMSITYGNGKFVAVCDGSNKVMTSPDGITWTAFTATEVNNWRSVTYGNGLFVAVSANGTNRVMTSPDGETWTARAATEANSWQSVTYGNGKYVAVARDGTNRVMTSTNGTSWTAAAAAEANSWVSVIYANGKFVAVSVGGTKRVMTSTDGITWTSQTTTGSNQWQSVTYGNGKYVAVAQFGTNQAMTSTDGITWTNQTTPAGPWYAVTYGNGMFVAVGASSFTTPVPKKVMTSTDGVSWTARASADDESWWRSVVYANDIFVAVANYDTHKIMTSDCNPVLTVTTQDASAIATTSATGNGTIFLTGTTAPTDRGIILYPYTDTDKVIGGTNVTNVNEAGTFDTGTFTASLPSLTVNTRYNARAHATDLSNGTAYGSRVDFWTLANVPDAPTVGTPTATTLNVAVNANANPATTKFAIFDTVTDQYVQANGSLGADSLWQTALTWGTKTVTGLTAGTQYTFKVKARNGGKVETAFGATASGTPLLLPLLTTEAASDITTVSANGNGDITDIGADDPTNRGIIWYPYTNTDKIIDGTDVTNVNETGTYDTGAYFVTLPGLALNNRYNARAHATNTDGTGYGARVDFWSLAETPAAPTVDNPKPTTLDVTINANGNPEITTYAIYDTVTGKYVQTNGTLGLAAAWQTEALWEVNASNTAKTVTGLLTNSLHTFKVKAKNGDEIETDFSDMTSLYTLAALPDAPTLNAPDTTSLDVAINANGNPLPTEFAIYGSSSGKYVQSDGLLGDAADWQTITDWGLVGSVTSTTTVTGLDVNTRYAFKVKARNEDNVETAFSDADSLYTLANAPSPPTVINPTANSLDVAVNPNGNPATTLFAIQDSTLTPQYVKADGTRHATAVWQTAAIWDTITVTGLSTGVTYYFRVKAKNGDHVETAFSNSASAYPYAKPLVTTLPASTIDTTFATANGNVTSIVGDTVTVRGLINYAYTGTDKLIGDAGVTMKADTGRYSIGAFNKPFTGMLVNSRYSHRAFAENAAGINYGNRVDFYTYANVPDAPTVINPTATSLDVVVQPNGNPASTLFAIQDSALVSQYVQINGTRGAIAVWQTAEAWDTITVTGLSTGVTYYFRVKAKNGDDVETAFGNSASAYPYAMPLVTTLPASTIDTTFATANGNVTSIVGDTVTVRGLINYAYTGSDKLIGDAGVTMKADTGRYGTGTFNKPFTGMLVNSSYSHRAFAKNAAGINYGNRVDFYTYANVPDAPTVINPTATSLDVAVNPNGNPATTLFAIQDSTLTPQYVKADGTRQATAVWQTAAAWDTITVTGLSTGVTYYFRVKAKNGDDVETAFGLSTGQNTCSNPTDGGEIGSNHTIYTGNTSDTLVNISLASNYGGTLEYQWQQASLADSTDFADITGADTTFYAPGTLTSTTWFRRLARVNCKADWTGAAASNVVKITVLHFPEVTITAPVDGTSVYTNPVTITGTAADTDANLSIVEVKLNDGTWQTATGTDTWAIDLTFEPGKNTILARAKDDTDLYSDTATINVLLSIQVINIPKGWSAISSYLTPQNPALPVMMDEITSTNNLAIMLSEYGIYWPPYNTNTIGNWNAEKGYKVKMNNAQEFTVRGDTLANRSISLSKGYHIIPVLSNVGCPITSVLADPLNDIFFMYDVKTNALYWPQGEIFSLTTLEPGKGYIASFNKVVILTYPAYSGFKSGVILDNTEPEMNGPWALVRTGDVHFIAISSEAVNNLENASFIGAFDGFGNCIGYTEVDGRGDNYLLSVYGNDATTDTKDGAEETEPISFRSYFSSSQTETGLIAEFNTSFPNADGLYVSGGQSGIFNFKESSTGIGEAGIAGDIQIYPNPAKDELNIAIKGFQTLQGFGTLMSADGKLVKSFTLTGNQTQLNVQDLQPGIYILRFENAENVVIKRVVIQ